VKVVILAGGAGTRLADRTELTPKPMVEIGRFPILWHIMKIYSTYGFHDFIVCLGYKGYLIKEYFANYRRHMSNITIDFETGGIIFHETYAEPWRVTLLETGEKTMTGGRLKRARPYIGEEAFCFTYGDGVASINIADLLEFHRKMGKLVTVTAVQPPGRFGSLEIQDGRVTNFLEKPAGDNAWINGGFFVVKPQALDFIEGDETVWEHEPMRRLAAGQHLAAFSHRGFWQPMDTSRDLHVLETLWESGTAPWKIWP
jgi:glucose-1-phosphate cytidylyltransferase